MKILIGTAGFVEDDRMDCSEISFTYGVRITSERLNRIKKLSNKLNINLSSHAPYYINLNSNDPLKIKQSMKRIVDTAVVSKELGANSVVFHPGFYMGKKSNIVYENIRDRIADIQDYLSDNDIHVNILPETTGKVSQFGSLSELIRLKDDLGINFCVDFSHLKARSNGTMNYKDMIEQIEPFKKIHSHFSGIHYGAKGEIKHLVTPKDSASKLLKAITNSTLKEVSIINESPVAHADALMMQNLRDELLN